MKIVVSHSKMYKLWRKFVTPSWYRKMPELWKRKHDVGG